MSLDAVHAMVRDLYRDADLLARFQTEPDAVLDRYDVSDIERQQLLEASPDALHALGMHPLVQMVYGVARNPAFKEQLAVTDYLVNLDAGGEA